MKVVVLIVFTLVNIIGFNQEKKNKIQLSSFGIDFGVNSFFLNNYFVNINDFIDEGNQITLINNDVENYYNSSYSSPSLNLNVGFDLSRDDKLTNELNVNLNFVPDVSISLFSNRYSKTYRLDSVIQYQVSTQNNDTTFSTILIDSTISTMQNGAYNGSALMIGANWKFNKTFKRITYGLAPGINLGTLLNPNVYEEKYSYYNVNQGNSYESIGGKRQLFKAKNVLIIQPNLEASIELKTKMRGNFLDPLSLIAKAGYGFNITLVENGPSLNFSNVNTSIGLRFNL